MVTKIGSITLLAAFAVCVSSQPYDTRAFKAPPPFPHGIYGLQHAIEHLPNDLSKYEPVNITIFFESLCPDSRNFFETQLYPLVSHNSIPKQLYNLEFVNYGNAYTTYDHGTKSYRFRCQHGSSECNGNMYQICHDYIVRNTTETLTFINCMFEELFSGMSVSDSASRCIQPLEVASQPLFNAWKMCFDTIAPALHAHEGARTDALEPRHTFIPWVIFDGEGSGGINAEAQYSLAEIILRYWFKKHNYTMSN